MLLLSLRPLIPLLFFFLGNSLTLAKMSKMQNACYRKIHLSQLLLLGKNNKQTLYSELTIIMICPLVLRHSSPLCHTDGVCLFVLGMTVVPRCWRLCSGLCRGPWYTICSRTCRLAVAISKSSPSIFLQTETGRFWASRGWFISMWTPVGVICTALPNKTFSLW